MAIHIGINDDNKAELQSNNKGYSSNHLKQLTEVLDIYDKRNNTNKK